MDRNEAEKKLKQIFGLERFYDLQWEVIKEIFLGSRILFIEKTGFGKSLCYQFPATQFDGTTVVFTPLIALMRDQVNRLNEKGILARCINSEQTEEENNNIINEAIDNRIKILYIAPERQENLTWIEAVKKIKLSMVVIDEAHTISIWGHDFRPAFRRIIKLVELLPKNFPVLATTATATERVQQDIAKQISGNVKVIRGSLIRENFELYVIKVNSEDEKMLWLAENLPKLEGTGIIYTGTKVNTEIYSKWLKYNDINAVNYNAGLDPNKRKEIESGLVENKWKVVISTNALGMGIDKPDIRFIIHTQIPASPIHYYQEIGRAGRDGKPAKIILFYNCTKDSEGIEEDYKLPKSFIDNARPSIENYTKVIEALKEEPLGERELIKATNLKQTQVRVIKADLIDQGIIKEVIYGKTKKYEFQFNAPKLNTKPFEELREYKLKELNSMIEYVNLTTSRMKFLCDYLGDNTPHSYKNCDNTNLSKYKVEINLNYKLKLEEFKENAFPLLEVESKGSNLINGIAAGYYGFSNIGSAIHRSKYENGGDFPDFLLELTIKAFKKYFSDDKFDFIVYVPPAESGDLVKNFAEKLSIKLQVPLLHNLIKKHSTKPQKIFQSNILKKENVKDKFDFLEPNIIKGKSIILFDDIYDSGATIKEIGLLLTRYGAIKILPLVLAKTVGGDV